MFTKILRLEYISVKIIFAFIIFSRIHFFKKILNNKPNFNEHFKFMTEKINRKSFNSFRIHFDFNFIDYLNIN